MHHLPNPMIQASQSCNPVLRATSSSPPSPVSLLRVRGRHLEPGVEPVTAEITP